MNARDEIMDLQFHEPHRCSMPLIDRAAALAIVERLDAKRKLARKALFELAHGGQSRRDYANKILAETAEDE